MTFGEKIQKLRKETGLSQEEMSFQLEVSRQAISKWENDKGYPETEKIVRMSKIFSVTVDYLLNEEESIKKEIPASEQGLYVSREMADGFLLYKHLKMRKIAWAAGLMVGGLSLVFIDSDISMLLFMVLIVAAIALFVSVKLEDNPYRKIWTEPLIFDKEVKKELEVKYMSKKKKANSLIVLGAVLIGAGFLVLPMYITVNEVFDTLLMGIGMVMAGAGLFLCIYTGGRIRAYRILVYNEEYHTGRRRG